MGPVTSGNEELVDVIDADDRVVRTVTRAEMRASNLRHRTTFVLVTSPRGEVLVHRRTETKDVYPGLHDVFFGGVVSAGETFDQAAVRELAEEAGIVGAPLRFLFRADYRDDRSDQRCAVYEVEWDGPIVLQEEEVAWGDWVGLDRAVAILDEWPFVPDGALMFRRWLDERGGA